MVGAVREERLADAAAEPFMASVDYLADGHHVDDAGNLICCACVDFRGPGPTAVQPLVAKTVPHRPDQWLRVHRTNTGKSRSGPSRDERDTVVVLERGRGTAIGHRNRDAAQTRAN